MLTNVAVGHVLSVMSPPISADILQTKQVLRKGLNVGPVHLYWLMLGLQRMQEDLKL